jgi:hypothetical protein
LPGGKLSSLCFNDFICCDPNSYSLRDLVVAVSESTICKKSDNPANGGSGSGSAICWNSKAHMGSFLILFVVGDKFEKLRNGKQKMLR